MNFFKILETPQNTNVKQGCRPRSEWVNEGEFSSKLIRIHAPSTSIHCQILGNLVDALYNPTIGANIMASSFALTCLGKELLAPTRTLLGLNSQSRLVSKGLMHDIHLHINKSILALDFHFFDIQDFDVLIGHPLENFFEESSKPGELDLSWGEITSLSLSLESKTWW